jgi:hypothetical protein
MSSLIISWMFQQKKMKYVWCTRNYLALMFGKFLRELYWFTVCYVINPAVPILAQRVLFRVVDPD